MAPRQAGAEVSVYLEHLEKWVDGIVEGYIKGFGYEASVILEDQVISGKYALKFVKRREDRGRSRSRSKSRSRIITNPIVVSDRRSRSRGRPRKTEKFEIKTEEEKNNLADWVWQNVKGEAESQTRRRRSRSKSRNSRLTEDGEMIPPPVALPIVEIASKIEREVTFSPSEPVAESPVVQAERSLVQKTISSCPWFTDLQEKWLSPIRINLQIFSTMLILPLIVLNLYDVVDHSNFFENFISYFDFCISLWITMAFLGIQRLDLMLSSKICLGKVKITHILAALLFISSSQVDVKLVKEWTAKVAASILPVLTIVAFAGVQEVEQSGAASFQSFYKWLHNCVLGNNKLFEKNEISRAGGSIGFFISGNYFFHYGTLSFSSLVITAIPCFIFGLEMVTNKTAESDVVCGVSGSGFLALFYSLVFVPFILTLPLRMFIFSSLAIHPVIMTISCLFFGISIQAAISREILKSHVTLLLGFLVLCITLKTANIFYALPLLYLLF